MKLSFLGKSYETPVSSVDAIETQEKLTFLGKRYYRKEYTVATRAQAPTTLTFLGRQYTR